MTKQPCNPRQSGATTLAPVLLRSSSYLVGNSQCAFEGITVALILRRPPPTVCVRSAHLSGNVSEILRLSRLVSTARHTVVVYFKITNIHLQCTLLFVHKPYAKKQNKTIYLARVVINRKTIPDSRNDWMRSGNTPWM